MTIPTNQDFATDVKVDRLRLLWRVTLVAAILLGWILLNVAMLQRSDVSRMIIPLVIVVIGTLVTRTLLIRSSYNVSAWVYILAGLLALGTALALGDNALLNVLPFAFPILVFIVGLLLQPANTLFVALLASVLVVVAPLFAGQSFLAMPLVQLSSIALNLISAVVAAQVAGDLYQIADWALSNYQRERRVAGELFDSQQALERSLARSTALGDRLQETNVELDQARNAAEEPHWSSRPPTGRSG